MSLSFKLLLSFSKNRYDLGGNVQRIEPGKRVKLKQVQEFIPGLLSVPHGDVRKSQIFMQNCLINAGELLGTLQGTQSSHLCVSEFAFVVESDDLIYRPRVRVLRS